MFYILAIRKMYIDKEYSSGVYLYGKSCVLHSLCYLIPAFSSLTILIFSKSFWFINSNCFPFWKSCTICLAQLTFMIFYLSHHDVTAWRRPDLTIFRHEIIKSCYKYLTKFISPYIIYLMILLSKMILTISTKINNKMKTHVTPWLFLFLLMKKRLTLEIKI